MDIEDRIRHAKLELKEEKTTEHILQAEWKMLISPERIQRLALKHLIMQPIRPNQIQEYDPSIFHSTKKKPNIKRLSKIIAKLSKESTVEN